MEQASSCTPHTATTEGAIASRYQKVASDGQRQEFIDRARECAATTIPSLMPEEGRLRGRLPKVYNSVPANGVKNIANKLLVALFPPNVPFFRHQMDDFKLADLAQDPKAKSLVEKALGKIERAVQIDFETTALRVAMGMALRQLVVVGNVLLYIDPKTGKGRAIKLTNYVVVRDPMGTVMEIIIKESIAVVLLPEEVRQQVDAKVKSEATDSTTLDRVDIYSRVVRGAKTWSFTQEVAGVMIDSAAGEYKLDECPYIALRLIAIDGEDYGRSFVEEHYGDIRSLELLTKAVVQQAATSAKILFLLKPNATTKAKRLAEAESGDIIEGNIDDIKALQVEKYNDFQVVEKVIARIESRLSYAFMMTSAIRQAERVTQEEVRRVIEELDGGMAGIHSMLSSELQLPLVHLIMARKTKARELPKLPKGAVKPAIVTGIEAIGRGNDLTNLQIAIQAVAPLPGALERINVGDLIERVFTAAGVNSDGLVTTDEEIAAQQQQQAMQEAMMKSAPGVAQEATKGVVQGQLQENAAAAPTAAPQQQAA